MSDEVKSDSTQTPKADAGLIEKAFLLGIGAAMMTRDKVNEFADELVQRGQMSQSDATNLASELASKADTSAASLQKTVAEDTGKAVAALGLASKKDIARLEDQILEIKALLAANRPEPGLE